MRVARPKADPTTNPYPQWPQILSKEWKKWLHIVEKAQYGPPVLLATGIGGNIPVAIHDSLLAVALTLRGASVHVLLCDSALPACEQVTSHFMQNIEAFAHEGVPASSCAYCSTRAEIMFREMGIALHSYTDHIYDDDRAWADSLSREVPLHEIDSFTWEGIPIGEHAVAGTLRFFARGTLEEGAIPELILRQYVKAALLSAIVARRSLKESKYESAAFHHGIYVPQGILGEVARQEQVRVVNHAYSHRAGCFVYSHGETYHHSQVSEPTSNWENMPWNEKMESELLTYLTDRQAGKRSWHYYYDDFQKDMAEISQQLGVDFSRPTVVMLTNVMWDAQIHFRTNIFANMLEWVLETVRYFISRPELQLIVRAHPAELRGTLPSRQPIIEEIKKAFPNLSKNVFLVAPESPISSYAIATHSNATLIYGTNTGVELAALGALIIVAGEASIRNKGIAIEPLSVSEYFDLLDRLPFANPMTPETLTRARMFAYHFFFRRMIPLPGIEILDAQWPPFRISVKKLDELMPGRNLGLDTVCEGILNGKEFIFPAEAAQSG